MHFHQTESDQRQVAAGRSRGPVFERGLVVKNRIRNRFDGRKQNREISSALRRHLDHEGRGRLRRVRCEVHQGSVVLWGQVCCAADRRLAVDIAQRCPHVEAVVNRIMVIPLPTTPLTAA